MKPKVIIIFCSLLFVFNQIVGLQFVVFPNTNDKFLSKDSLLKYEK